MKCGVWVPPWMAIKSNVCARWDCNELRHETEKGVRRYCEQHCKEYKKEANATPANEKLLRPSCFSKRS